MSSSDYFTPTEHNDISVNFSKIFSYVLLEQNKDCFIYFISNFTITPVSKNFSRCNRDVRHQAIDITA